MYTMNPLTSWRNVFGKLWRCLVAAVIVNLSCVVITAQLAYADSSTLGNNVAHLQAVASSTIMAFSTVSHKENGSLLTQATQQIAQRNRFDAHCPEDASGTINPIGKRKDHPGSQLLIKIDLESEHHTTKGCKP